MFFFYTGEQVNSVCDRVDWLGTYYIINLQIKVNSQIYLVEVIENADQYKKSILKSCQEILCYSDSLPIFLAEKMNLRNA